jgi:hypothetical protein
MLKRLKEEFSISYQENLYLDTLQYILKYQVENITKTTRDNEWVAEKAVRIR